MMFANLLKRFCARPLMGRHVNSSMPSLFGRSVYGSTIFAPDAKPANFLIRTIYERVAVPLANFQNWLANRYVRKFNIVDLQCEPAFYDADYRIELALFRIVGDYCEHELGSQADLEKLPDYDPADYKFYHGYRLHSSGDGDKIAIDAWMFFKENEKRIRGQEGLHDSTNPLEDQKDMHLKNILQNRGKFWI